MVFGEAQAIRVGLEGARLLRAVRDFEIARIWLKKLRREETRRGQILSVYAGRDSIRGRVPVDYDDVLNLPSRQG